MTYNPEIHNRRSYRLSGHDYSKPGSYFITICTHNRERIFCDIVEDMVVLNEIGKTIENLWVDLPLRYPILQLDKFVIMPNHLHGVLIINSKSNESEEIKPKIPPPTIAKMIAYFKYESTSKINLIRKGKFDRLWQRNYYDHIIRNADELTHIRDYIKSNPKNWTTDDMYV